MQEDAMRLTVHFQPENGELILPLNYGEILQGFLYRSIHDLELADFLHNEGFAKDRRKFKLFTYSRLAGNYRIDAGAKQIRFEGPIRWQISSLLDRLIADLGQSFLFREKFTIHDQPVRMEETSVHSFRPEKRESYRIRMLSPLTVFSTYEDAAGKKKTHYYSPSDLAFSDMVEKNFSHKYEAYYGRPPEERLRVRPVKVSPRDKVVTVFKGTRITAWNGIYEIVCPPDYLKFLYDVGIGAKNSQGFGMFESVE